MSLCTIILIEENSKAWDKLKKSWPEDYFILDGRQAFVSTDDLTSEIAEKIGIGSPDDGASGLVIQMGYYSGTGPSNAVEWVNKKLQKNK